MSQQMLVAGVAIATLATAFAGAVRFLVKHYLSELKTDGNGGHNLRGRVDRIELRVDEIYRLLLERNG